MTLALYGKSRKRQGLLGLLAVLAIALGIMLATTLPGPGGSQGALATDSGNCWGDGGDDGSKNDIELSSYTITAPAGKEIEAVCIKSGNTAFSGTFSTQSSGPISADGTYGWNGSDNGTCYVVAGFSTDPTTTVDIDHADPFTGCKAISHIQWRLKDLEPDLTASKTNNIGGSVTPQTFDWTITITNEGGGAATFVSDVSDQPIIFRDLFPSGVTVNSIFDTTPFTNVVCSVPSANDVRCVPDGSDVVIGAGVSFDVIVNVTISAAGTYNNGTDPSVCKVDFSNVVAETDENNNTCSDSVTLTDPPTDRDITICKVVDDNGDDDNDGGTFSFSLSNATNFSSATNFGLNAHEDDAQTVCTTYTRTVDDAFDVTETGVPTNWSNVSGYPQVQIDTGGKTQSSTTQIPAGTSNVTVTFYNKILPDPKIIVIKVNPNGDANDVFNIDVSNTTNSQLHTYALKHGESDMDFVPAETYDVIEQDPTNVGNGYLAPQYVAILNGGTTCPTSPSPTAGVSPQALAAGDVWLVCVYNTPEPPTIQVHIAKYVKVDGSWVHASAANTGSASFAMASSWSASNIGTGSGTYTLDPTGANNPNPYEASTSEMSVPADYATNETNPTTTCTGGAWRLVGYTAASGAYDTNSANVSGSSPDFDDLTADKYVVVWNEPCPGSITIIKDSVPDHEQDFTFNVTGQGGSTLDDNGNDSDTLSNVATYSSLAPGKYDVTENHPLAAGWTLTSVSCTGAGNADIPNGVKVDLSPNENVVCTFTNTLSPKIVVKKVNPGANFANDTFIIDVSNTTQSNFKSDNYKHGDSKTYFVPTDTYDVIEQNPVNVGNGYLPPKYAEVNNNGTTCPAEPILNSDLPPRTLVAGQVWLVCVYNFPAAPPTWEKVAANPSYANGAAQWVINVSNPTQDGINRTVKIDESGEGNSFSNLGACSESGGIVTCDLAPGGTASFNVSRTVGQLCEESSASNSATAAVYQYKTSTWMFALPNQGPINAVILGNEELCGDPLILKTANNFTSGDGFATWDITIDNTDPVAIERVVTITDGDALVGGIPNECGSPSGSTDPLNLTCTIGAGEVLVLTVQRAVTETCDGFTLTNSATATMEGDGGPEHIQGSPTDAIAVVIPANSRFCDSTVSVTKRFDTGTVDGFIDASDAFVPFWGISLTCTGFGPVNTATAANGTVVFTVPGPGDGPDLICTTSEATDILYVPLGGSLNGGALNGATSVGFTLAGNDSATIVFLNDPITLTTPTPPPTTTPPPTETPTPTPETPEPEPTQGIEVETPQPEPTEAIEATPVAPDTGSGTTTGASNGTVSFLFIVLALMAFSGALGAISLARGKNS